MTRKGWKIAGGAIGVLCLVFVCIFMGLSSQRFMTAAAEKAGSIAASALDTRISLGTVQVKSWRELQVDGIDVYDKRQQLLAHADEAVIRLNPLAMLEKSAAEGISSIDISRADVTIVQREDGTWNFADLVSEEKSDTRFTAKINVSDSTLRSRYNNQDIVLEKVNGYVDMAAYPAVSLKAECENQGASAQLSATIDTDNGARQTFQLSVQNAELADYVQYLPAGTIPEDTVKDISGRLSGLQIAGERIGTELYYSGQAELADGSFVLLGENKVEKAKALVTFNEKEVRVFASGETQGQQAAAHGRIIMNGGSPLLDMNVSSDGFEPTVIFKDIPYEGAVKFTAHVTGAVDAPRVDANVQVASGRVQNMGFSGLKADVSYGDSMIVVNNASAGIAGGAVSLTGTFDARTYDFTGRAGLQSLQAGQLAALVNSAVGGENGADGSLAELASASGSISGDVSFAGNMNEPGNIKLFGNIKGQELVYQGLTISQLDGSVGKQGDRVTVDYLSCLLPGGGSFGLEGNVVLNQSVDLSFYGSNVDLSLLDTLLPEAPIAGFLDIKGTMQGDIHNPVVRAKYAARDGSIYHQPFDRLHGSAGGSLRGVKINDFVMEKGEKTKWYAQGMLGFLGDRGINMRVDTVSARMEDIMQAVAPDQKLTGNVDNVITITGTLKNPDITGYVHFYQGSYNGIFINGMDGDYFVKDGTVTLQDFHVFTPWLDVDFNGTIDPESNIDLDARVHEIDLSRYNKYLPMPLQGKAGFSGKLTGTVANPLFEGRLSAQDLAVNGQAVTGVGGIVQYSDGFVFFKDMTCQQKDGTYTFNGNANISNQRMRGRLVVDKGDIHSIVSAVGLPDNGINGTISGNALIGGTLTSPEVKVNAIVTDGFLGSYPLDDVMVDAALDKRKIFIDDFSGREGASGSFSLRGTIDLDGDVDVHAALKSVDVGAFTEAVGIRTRVGGILNTEFDVTGTCAAPYANIPVDIRNLQVESTMLDSLEGQLVLAGDMVSIQRMTASKSYNSRTYSLTASGQVPFAALRETMPTESNQFDVTFALENADLSLLPTLSQYIDWAVGPTDGRLRLQGTAARPYITGRMAVSEGAFKIRDVVKPVTDFNMRLVFNGNLVTLEQCRGTMGSGSFSSTGFVHLDGIVPDNYSADLALDGLEVDSPVFRGPVTANVNLRQEPITLPDGTERFIPKVSGRMLLDNVLISLPSELPQSSDDMPLVGMDFNLELGKNVRFLSPSLGDLRLAGGAYFGGTTLMPNTSGSVYVKKGNLSYLKTNFKVYEGSMTFGQAGTLMPKLVLRAGTKINKTSVFLSLDGLINKMRFRLMSNPKMSEADIIQLLTLRSDYYNRDKSDGSRFASMLNIGLQMTILSEVEAAMRNVLNLDVLTIERDTIDGSKNLDSSTDGSGAEKNRDNNDYEVYNITLGKNISDKALIKYTQSVTTNDYSYGLDYELSDRVNLTYKRNQDNDYYAGVEARFTF